jgi:hypothetical protein
VNKDALIAEVRRRINDADSRESFVVSASTTRWVESTPSWGDYFTGYRDALGELIEWLEETNEQQ